MNLRQKSSLRMGAFCIIIVSKLLALFRLAINCLHVQHSFGPENIGISLWMIFRDYGAGVELWIDLRILWHRNVLTFVSLYVRIFCNMNILAFDV